MNLKIRQNTEVYGGRQVYLRMKKNNNNNNNNDITRHPPAHSVVHIAG